MPPQDREYCFTYRDLAAATGLARNTVSQHVVRAHLDPHDIESVAIYLARYGSDELREQMVRAMIRRDVPEDPGGWKKRKKVKR